MAIDCWLFEQCYEGLQPPTLRFYTWSPPALSLGHHQRQWPNHWQGLKWHDRSLDIVRRPTGGRAVLHAGDLTYSIVLTQQSGNRRETYEYICGFLIQGLKALGVELQFGQTGRGYQRQANCFESATAADLIGPNGEKLIGSAQVWHGSTVLQHGSIQLNPNPDLFQQVFGTEARSGNDAIASPKAWPIALDATIHALTQSSENYFKKTFIEQPLTPAEWNAIQGYLKLTEA
jgi:lipoate---protein ligase